MILRLSLDLPGDQEFVRTTRLLSRTLLEDLQVTTEDTDAIELVVGELCSNVVRHASDARHTNPPGHNGYHVVIEYHRAKVVLMVEDKGPGFDPSDIPAPGTTRADSLAEGDCGNGKAVAERIGGFGIPLVAALSDYLDFEPTSPTGTTVRAEKKLHYQSAQAEARARKMEGHGDHSEAVIQVSPQ